MSSDSQNSRSGAVSPSQCSLHMDCDEEELSESQMNFYITKKRAFSDTMAKLEEMARAGAVVTNNSDGSTTFRVTETSSNLGPVSHQPVMPGNQQYRFVVDKSGRILGSVPGQGGQMVPGGQPPVRAPTPSSRGRSSAATVRLPSRSVPQRKLSPAPQTTPAKNPQVVDLTRTMEPNSPGGMMRKTFPALSVTAKPQKTVPASQAKRPELDAKVKSLLVNTPAKFTEWLIQQGLVRSEQYENVPGQGKVKLKLGMYSDGKKFPHSGGYVWIQEGSSNKYISVFRGSIFESTTGESQSPTVMLKLLYHWSCQTNIPNVANWVKVDNKKIDHFFKLMRSVCVAAVQDEVVGLGGPRGGAVEVGVISLGTTTADGQKREVRVEVLGIMDRATRQIRLRATEPIPGATQSERFSKIFETLPIWVQPNSKIVTDFSVDKDTLVKLGYKNVTQCSLSQAQSTRMEGTNQQIMEYLKKVVPKMFQNTLSNLSTPVIQQFLDELTFRELFANFPLACFDAIIQRISSQTSAYTDAGSTMVDKLASVSANPFLDWRFSEKSLGLGTKMLSVKSKSPSPAASKRAGSSDDSDLESIKKTKVGSREMIPMESYFYSTLPGDDWVLANEFKADMAFKCHVCKKVFMNNLEFMKHLHLHVETDRETAIDMADLSQCKYCYKDFDCETKVMNHENLEHFKIGTENLCQICKAGFPVKNNLIQHMLKAHVKYEMPYSCKVCGHRTSQHQDIVEHFQLEHDRTDKLQCPHCLKTFNLYSSDKGYNSAATINYLQHLQRHEDLKNKNKSQNNCKKCVLKFTEDKYLKIHASEDHLSYKEHENVEPHQYVATDEPTQFPAPDERNVKTAPKKNAAAKTVSQQSAFAAQNLEDLAIYDAQGEKCCECNRSMTQQGHYVAYLCCTKCRYSSCCAKAMSEHVKIFHSGGPPVFDLGKSVILKEPMYCVCGYSAHSGMKLAKHIGRSGCQTAYPTIQEANKAKVERDGSGGGTAAEEGSSGAPSNVDDESSRDSSSAKSVENGPTTEPMEEDKEEEGKDKEENAPASVETEVTTKEDQPEGEKADDETTEKDSEEKDNEEKEKDEDEGGEDDNQPGPGGFLFGTFFNPKKDDKKEEESNNEDKNEDKNEGKNEGENEGESKDEAKNDEGKDEEKKGNEEEKEAKEDTTNKESEDTETSEDKNSETSEKMDTE